MRARLAVGIARADRASALGLDLEARERDPAAAAAGTVGRAGQASSAREVEAALEAGRALDAKAFSVCAQGAGQVLQVLGDVALRNAYGSREIARGSAAGGEDVA
jgi:hypothetical protein